MTDPETFSSTQSVVVPSVRDEPVRKSAMTAHLVTLIIILTGTILAVLFSKEINGYGVDLMTRFGQGWVDVILFFVTAISCTPLMLPVWAYAVAGAALGLDIVRLALVMALGSALGGLVTFAAGRYYGNRSWVQRRFPRLREHPWTHGKSKKYVTLILFLGSSSPIPCDIVYAACGAKRFPVLPFLMTLVAGRFVRYIYLGYGFIYISDYF